MKRDIWVLFALAVGGYVVYRILSDRLGNALESVGSAIGSGLFDLFHRNQVGETLFYTVQFPPAPLADGQKHAVPSSTVDKEGRFRLPKFFGTKLFRIVLDKQGFKHAAVN